MNEVPPEVLDAYGFSGCQLEHIPSLINRTLLVTTSNGERFVLQRLHPVFSGEVNRDIAALTEHLVNAGLETPLLVPTKAGALWFDEPGGTWRTQTFVAGLTRHEIESAEQANGAGFFVAKFHRALANVIHHFSFQRGNPHDTPSHLARLRAALETEAGRADQETSALCHELLEHASALRVEFDTPKRLCHGDLKLSNLLFFESAPTEVRCLIDLDTLGPQTIAFELGDALRSWCNPQGENEVTAEVDVGVFEATLRGYARGASGLLTREEQGTIVDGLAAVSVELASRFARDAIEDRYWGWDARRYPTRRAHNLVRARSQLALSRSAVRHHARLTRIVEQVFSPGVAS